MPFNFPIFLTWLRILFIPLIVGIYYLPDTTLTLVNKDLLAAVFFVAAGLTDWFDGFFARKWNQTSAFGAFLDPVADKLMVSAALLILLQLGRIGMIVALVIIGREITISALREWMAKVGEAKSVAVNSLGKLKTACQMTAIPMLLFYNNLSITTQVSIDTRKWGLYLIYVAALLTLWSMCYYILLARPFFKKKNQLI